MKDLEDQEQAELPCDACKHTTCGPHIPYKGKMIPVKAKSCLNGKSPCDTCPYGKLRKEVLAKFKQQQAKSHAAA